MRRLPVIILTLLLPVWLSGQSLDIQVIAGSGSFQKNATYDLSWTVGELKVKTYSGGCYFLTQGFHQGKYSVNVFPVATVFDVTGTGNFCVGDVSDVLLSDSESNIRYELIRDGTGTGVFQNGDGSGLTFSGINTNGAYTIRAFTIAHPGCEVLMNGTATLLFFVIPTTGPVFHVPNMI
jgi:hypothetical protein